MSRWIGEQTFGCNASWTCQHQEELMWVKSKLAKKGTCSVKNPVDLTRLLSNADRHASRLYLHVTAMKALLDMYPELICLTASLLPHLGDGEIGLNENQREVAAEHLRKNPDWQKYFTNPLRQNQHGAAYSHNKMGDGPMYLMNPPHPSEGTSAYSHNMTGDGPANTTRTAPQTPTVAQIEGGRSKPSCNAIKPDLSGWNWQNWISNGRLIGKPEE